MEELSKRKRIGNDDISITWLRFWQFRVRSRPKLSLFNTSNNSDSALKEKSS